MHALTVSANPEISKSSEIDEFIVIPPRFGPFTGETWVDDLSTYLARLFPALKLHIHDEPGMRQADEPIVLPMMGTAGSGSDPGRIKPITIKTNKLMDEIRMALRTYVPGEALRLN